MEAARTDPGIERLLGVVCEKLGLETAFIGRIADGRRTVCHVGGGGLSAGDTDPVEESYCQLVVEGAIDAVVPDVSRVPELASLAITSRLGIGSYVGLPLTMSDGSLYGTLCAYGREANPNLTSEDIRLLELVAALVADRLEEDVRSERTRSQAVKVISDFLAEGQPRIVFQPIVDTSTGASVGFESLARFDTDPYRTPDVWFGAAIAVGLGADLEAQAIRNAVRAAARLPPGRYLTLNASPELVRSGRLQDLLTGADRPLVIELTEHEHADVADFAGPLADLRAQGHRVAMDDVGSGHSGLVRLLALQPDIVKLDRFLISGIDTDLARRSLVAAVVGFAAVAGGTVVAEGVETAAEQAIVEALGVRYAQGYFFGRPADAATFIDLLEGDAVV